MLALSTGEAEFYSAVKAGSAGIGTLSMFTDLGVPLERESVELKVRRQGDSCLEIQTDASAGRGIAMRRGAGRIRHIATPTLWLQKHIQDGRISILKVPGAENCADLGTKHLDSRKIEKHL